MIVRFAFGASEVVHEEHRGAETRKELFQDEKLTPVSQRILCEEPHLRETVEDDTAGLDLLDLSLDQFDRFAELHLPAMKDRLVPPRTEHVVSGAQFENIDVVEIPTVGRSDDVQFLLCLGKGDVKTAFSPGSSFQQELDGERRLAGARRPLEKI